MTYGANATQESKSAANQTGEKGQSMLNQTGEAAQSFMNKTGKTLQQINPFKSPIQSSRIVKRMLTKNFRT